MTETNDRLYGQPGDEHMHFDAESVLDSCDKDEVEIEEWTVRPPREHLPPVDHLLEWIAESDYDVTEEWWESARDAVAHEDVKALAEKLLETIAEHITYRMADRRVAVHTYRWVPAAEPAYEDDGEYELANTVYADTPART